MSRRRQPTAEGTGQTPAPLRDPRTIQFLQACGEHIGLAVEHFVETNLDYDVGYKILRLKTEQQSNILLCSQYQPLQRALMERHATCQCSPFNSMAIMNRVTSGSVAEGLATPPRPPYRQTTSDADVMYELGPVDWLFPNAEMSGATVSTPSVPAPIPDKGSKSGDPRPQHQLMITETENPGFVLLLQERRSDCSHKERLPFKAEEVSKFFSEYTLLTSAEDITSRSANGPACSYSMQGDEPFFIRDRDDVPCLHVPVWCISDEFFTRHRQYNWPPEDVMENIRQFGLHLVPVGAPGSKTETIEWRLSFSRAELLIVCLLKGIQRIAAIALKMCKTAFGEEGKTLKSYYVKTALLWLCEQGEEWTSVHQGILKLVDFLDEAVRKGNLPCFFWSKINLLRFTKHAERKAMKKTLGIIKKCFMKLIAHDMCVFYPELPMIVAVEQKRGKPLTERQVRTCLARHHIIVCVRDSIRMYITMTTAQSLNSLFPVLLRSFSPAEVTRLFRRLAHWRVMQNALFHTFLLAPEDVASQVGLTSSQDGGFVLDAAPLLALLTENDLRVALGDPREARSWLKRQQRLPEAQRPAAAPADLTSPRDLCDLLLNTPPLCRALRESVPSFWNIQERSEKENPMSVKSFLPPQMMLCGAAVTANDKLLTLYGELQTKLGMDRQEAEETFCRVAQEMEKTRDNPQVVAQLQRICRSFPDYWNLWHFVLARI